MKLTGQQEQNLIAVVIAVLLFLIIFALMTCQHRPAAIVITPTIDASAANKRIDDELDAAVALEAERMKQLEIEHAADLANFDAQQAAEYEQVRKQGRQQVARWLTDFARAVRDAGVPR